MEEMKITDEDFTEITETDYEEMCRLAEVIVDCLHRHFEEFDAEGNEIYKKYSQSNECENFQEDVDLLMQQEMDAQKALPECYLLHDLFCSPDLDVGEVRCYAQKDILPLIEPIIPKALHLFRKGAGIYAVLEDAYYKAADSVPDEFLITVFAREVRNQMMIFAVQKMQIEKWRQRRYLVTVVCGADIPYDDIKGYTKGIYFDDEDLKEAYEKAVAEVEEHRRHSQKTRRPSRDRYVTILEYSFGQRNVDMVAFREVKPEDLQCFKKE